MSVSVSRLAVWIKSGTNRLTAQHATSELTCPAAGGEEEVQFAALARKGVSVYVFPQALHPFGIKTAICNRESKQLRKKRKIGINIKEIEERIEQFKETDRIRICKRIVYDSNKK